jgi:hypothetical protein
MSTKRAADQLGYPAVVLLIDRKAERRYQSVAISAEEDCNPEHIGACCYLGDHARPRYIVDGIERPDFDPTIPDDLRATGWFWHGGWLTHYNEPPPKGCGLSVGMPVENLDEIWTKARKLAAAGDKLAAARAAEEAKKASKPAKKPTERKAQPAPAAPAAPPAVVVVVKKPSQTEQLALW